MIIYIHFILSEVYKPYDDNLFYYDVNSLYPYSSLNAMPGSKCYFENDINLPLEKVDNLFGFFYVKINADVNNYLGLLPVRSKQGLILPNGNW